MKWLSRSWIMAVTSVTATAPAFALVGADLLSCQQTRFFKTKCTVTEGELASRAVYTSKAGRSVEVDTKLDISYEYPCQGHAMKIAVTSERESAELKYRQGALLVQGFGPFAVKNLSPGPEGLTYKATVNPGCYLKLTGAARDLSDVSLQILNEKLAIMRSLNTVLKSVRDSATLFGALASVLDSLDAEGIHGVLENARDEAESLKASTDSIEAQDALEDAIAEVDIALALNPAVTPASELKQRASRCLSRLQVEAAKVVGTAVPLIQARHHDGSAMLAFASGATKRTFQPQLDAEMAKTGN